MSCCTWLRRPPHCYADRLYVSPVILVRLRIRAHELWAHQPHFMPKLDDISCPVVSTPAGLHSHQARFKPHYDGSSPIMKDSSCRRRNSRCNIVFPRASTLCTEKTFFAKSMPNVLTSISDPPSLFVVMVHYHHGPLRGRFEKRGLGPYHQATSAAPGVRAWPSHAPNSERSRTPPFLPGSSSCRMKGNSCRRLSS